MRLKIAIVCLSGFWAGLAEVCADVRLAPVFGSNMVLQRDAPAKLVGWADVGEQVRVELCGQVVGQAVGAGKDTPWTVLLPAQKAGAIPDILVSGKNRVALTNLLAGDVWVCSGQSNMAQTLQRGEWCGYGGVLNVEQEMAEANHPQLRFFKSQSGQWEVCVPDTARSFSAASYFFGRELQEKLKVPVGLVMAAAGGTMAELWIPRPMLEDTPEFIAALAEAKRTQEELKPKEEADRLALQEWNRMVELAKKEEKAVPARPLMACTWNDQDRLRAAASTQGTGQLYTRLIAPLTALSIKGVIWYQGESNTRKASEYERLMTRLIQSWRKAWGQGDFSFLIMQLVNFEFSVNVPWHRKATFAALREAQQAVADEVPNTGLAVGIDIGEGNNIHPPNKQEVGRRLALVALKQVYGQDVVASGPALTDARFEAGKVTLAFDPGGKEQSLVFKACATNGFEVAGADGAFVPATAQQNGNTIILAAAGVTTPRAVRYAWADNPPATLFNTAGLPAAPFRRTAVSEE